jgi:hypothetical protein
MWLHRRLVVMNITEIACVLAANPVPVTVSVARGLMAVEPSVEMVMPPDEAAVMVTEVEPDFVVSSVLVAVTVTGFVAGTALGAVYRPAAEIIPSVELPPGTPPTLHVTVEA